MRDEVDLVLASLMDADLVSPSASMLRLLCSTQPIKMTSARICLIQSAFKPGESFTCPSGRSSFSAELHAAGIHCWTLQKHEADVETAIDMAFHVNVRAWLSSSGQPLTRLAPCCRAWCRRPGSSSSAEPSTQSF